MKTSEEIFSEKIPFFWSIYDQEIKDKIIQAAVIYARGALKETSKKAKIKYRDPSELEVSVYGLGKIAFIDEESITSIELK